MIFFQRWGGGARSSSHSRLPYLHSGLDDVEGRVSKDAGGAGDGSEGAGQQGVDGLVGVVT